MMKKLILGAALAYACAGSVAQADNEEKVLIDPLIFTTPHLALREGGIDEFSRACDEMDGIINASNSGGAMIMRCTLSYGGRFTAGWSQDRYLSIEEVQGLGSGYKDMTSRSSREHSVRVKDLELSMFKSFESIFPCTLKGSCDADFIVTRDEHLFGIGGAKIAKIDAQVITITVQPKNRLGTGLHVDERRTVQIIGR